MRRVLNVLFFLLGDSPASEFYVLTFRNTLSVPSSWMVSALERCKTECFETSAHKFQNPGNHRKESIKMKSFFLLKKAKSSSYPLKTET